MPEKAVDGDQTIDFFKVNALFNPSEALQSPHAMALLSTLQRVGTHAVKSDTVSKWMHLTTLGSNGQQAVMKGIVAMSERQEVVTLRAFSSKDPKSTFDILHQFCEHAYGDDALRAS